MNDGTPYAMVSPTLRYARKSLILDPVIFPFALIDNSVPVGNTNFSLVSERFAAKVVTPTVLPIDFASVKSKSLTTVMFLPTVSPSISIGSLIWN